MKIPLRGAVACLLKFLYSLFFFIDNDLPRGGYFESRAGKGNCLGGCFGAWEDVLELDRMLRRFLLGKQRDEYLLKNHS